MEGESMSVARTAKPKQTYSELIREFPLRPIRNDREVGRAMKIASRLAVYEEDTLAQSEQDYLNILTILIEDYERNNCTEVPEVTPLAMLKHLMEENEMNISDLGRLI